MRYDGIVFAAPERKKEKNQAAIQEVDYKIGNALHGKGDKSACFDYCHKRSIYPGKTC